jgi:uncharacterized membrane protein
MFLKILAILVGSAILVYISTAILSFFGIGIEMYANYLIWFIAMIILSVLLPKKTGEIFDN